MITYTVPLLCIFEKIRSYGNISVWREKIVFNKYKPYKSKTGQAVFKKDCLIFFPVIFSIIVAVSILL